MSGLPVKIVIEGRRDPDDRDTPATECDGCSQPIPYGATCYAPRTGELRDGLPVVRVVCAACFGLAGDSE